MKKKFNYYFDKAPVAFILMIFPFLVFFFDLIGALRASVWLFTPSKIYLVKHIKIDTMEFYNSDGSEPQYIAFSKSLNNNKMPIEYGYLGTEDSQTLMYNYENKVPICVWVHPDRDWADPVDCSVNKFSYWDYWYKQLFVFNIFLISILNYIFWTNSDKIFKYLKSKK